MTAGAGMRRTLVVTVFLAVLAAALVGGHLYLARRLVLDVALPAPWRTAALAAVALLAASLVLQPLSDRLAPVRAGRMIAWVASLWMGIAFYLLVLLLATDVLAVLLGALVEAGGDLRAARVRALGVGVAAAAIGIAGVRAALRGPAVRRVEIRLARWPAALDGFRIVQLSDLHIGPILDRRFATRVVTACNALAPDLIAITGDLVDGGVRRLADEVAPFAGLVAPHGVYFVTGNHDYYSGAERWVAHVQRLGPRVLRNERVTITRDGASFDLAGVEDFHAHLVSGTGRSDVRAALAGREAGRPVILLAHDPGTFPEAVRHGVDLQLSGHTHGGQLWPFSWLVRLATPYVAGLHRRDGSQVYVSCGTGFWGPAMRVRAPAEMTELVLRSGGGRVSRAP